MRQTLATLTPLLRLTRLAVGVGALVNAWFVVLWSRANPIEKDLAPPGVADSPLWQALLGSALCGLGLYAFAAVLNDLVDRRRDAALHPARPLPSGRVSISRASAMLVAMLGLALTGAAWLGREALWMTLGTAGTVVAFNTAGKFVPSAAVVMLSLIYGAQMMTPNVHLVFVWPVCLAMAHAMAVGAMAHRAGERRPVLSRRAKVAAVAGWAFWIAVLLGVGAWRGDGLDGAGMWANLWPGWVPRWAGVAPGVLAVVFLLYGRGVIRSAMPGPSKAAAIQRAGALWLAGYGAAWLLGMGRLAEAALLLAVAGAGVAAMFSLRGLFDAVENPARYLR